MVGFQHAWGKGRLKCGPVAVDAVGAAMRRVKLPVCGEGPCESSYQEPPESSYREPESRPIGNRGASETRRNLRKIGAPLTILIEKNIRSEEHTSELQSLMRISYDVICLHKKKTQQVQVLQHDHT